MYGIWAGVGLALARGVQNVQLGPSICGETERHKAETESSEAEIAPERQEGNV